MRPFTRADGLAAGIDPRLLRGSRFRRIFKGVYVSSTRAPSARLRAEAALTVHPLGAYVSHHTAARVYELAVPLCPEEHVTVLEENHRRRRREIRCHVADGGARVTTWNGVRISTPIGLFVELAEYLSLVDLVIVGDALARRRWVTPDQLVDGCTASRHRFAAVAHRAARLVREGVDSPMETRLRMLIVLAGLPEPEVNFVIRNEAGVVIRRFDLSYPHLKLIVEYDGRQHAENPEQYDSDIYRREDLDRWGWRIIIVTAKSIYADPHQTLSRVRTALLECGATGLRSRFSDEWQVHFPARAPVRRTS